MMKNDISDRDKLGLMLEEMDGIIYLQKLVYNMIEEKYICGEEVKIVDRYVSGYLIDRHSETLLKIDRLITRNKTFYN